MHNDYKTKEKLKWPESLKCPELIEDGLKLTLINWFSASLGWFIVYDLNC